MNAAHDIKILDMYLQFGRECNKKCFLESKILPSINRYPIFKEKKKNWKKNPPENKTQFSLVKNQLNGLSKRVVALRQNITFL